MSLPFPVGSAAHSVRSRSILLRQRERERMWEPLSTVMFSGQLLVGSGAGVRLRVAPTSAPLALSVSAHSVAPTVAEAVHESTCAIASTSGETKPEIPFKDIVGKESCCDELQIAVKRTTVVPSSSTGLQTTQTVFSEPTSSKPHSKRECAK